MLSPGAKATIDSLSPEELEHEINLGTLSRFHGEKLAYLKTRKALLSERKADSERLKGLSGSVNSG